MKITIKTVKKMAAKILKVGLNRVWIDPSQHDKASTAITKNDVRSLIKSGIIRVKPERGTSRVRARKAHKKRKKGLRKGPGSRKGHKASKGKEEWMKRVRALRAFLVELRRKRLITKTTYRMLYLMVKSGTFRSRAQLKAYITDKNLIKAMI